MPAKRPRPPLHSVPPPGRRLASVATVAELYDVDGRTVRRWIADGTITGYRVGKRSLRVDLAEVEAKAVRPIPTAAAGGGGRA